MRQAAAAVALFHSITDTPINVVPTIPPLEREVLRWDLIDEEVNRELKEAIIQRDMVGIADGAIDSIYVIIGLMHEYGLPVEALFKEVQRANMAKAHEQDDGSFKCIRREDGKILKPEGWEAPDIEGVLRAHGWDGSSDR